jgi:phosphohistidine phosphatase
LKTLHLLRHAKSDWSDGTLPDHDRPLNKRGRRARKLIAAHVDGWPVDLVVCSTAVRARATAEAVVDALGCECRFEPAIYRNGLGDLVSVVRELPSPAEVVLLTGHNPGIEELTEFICGDSPAYVTAALGTIELDVASWADVDRDTGRLTALVTPADLGEVR